VEEAMQDLTEGLLEERKEAKLIENKYMFTFPFTDEDKDHVSTQADKLLMHVQGQLDAKSRSKKRIGKAFVVSFTLDSEEGVGTMKKLAGRYGGKITESEMTERKERGGRGTGKYTKGEQITDVSEISVGDLLINEEERFGSTNLIKVTRVQSDPSAASYGFDYQYAIGAQEPGGMHMWGHEFEEDGIRVLYKAIPGEKKAKQTLRTEQYGEDDEVPEDEMDWTTTLQPSLHNLEEFTDILFAEAEGYGVDVSKLQQEWEKMSDDDKQENCMEVGEEILGAIRDAGYTVYDQKDTVLIGKPKQVGQRPDVEGQERFPFGEAREITEETEMFQRGYRQGVKRAEEGLSRDKLEDWIEDMIAITGGDHTEDKEFRRGVMAGYKKLEQENVDKYSGESKRMMAEIAVIQKGSFMSEIIEKEPSVGIGGS
jgi:hypothetical protein